MVASRARPHNELDVPTTFVVPGVKLPGKGIRSVVAVVAGLLAVVSAIWLGARSASTKQVVLGAKDSFVPGGVGWGVPHPAKVFNGGDPTGHAWDLRWRDWGKPIAYATGRTWILSRTTPSGRLEFRASRIGYCASRGPRAYTRLEVRVAPLRGGRFGPWELWSDRPNLCHPRRFG